MGAADWRVSDRASRTADAGGWCAYFVAHHHKREQAPPAGFNFGKRFRPSRGYFSEPLPALREQARAQRRRGIALWALIEQYGDDLEVQFPADELERLLAAEQARARPELVRIQRVPTAFRETADGGCEPTAWETEVLGRANEEERSLVAAQVGEGLSWL